MSIEARAAQLSPKRERSEVKAEMAETNRLRAWTAFASCQKNAVVMEAVVAGTGGRCALCGQSHGTLVGHHVDYVHVCASPGRDCGDCALRKPADFQSCVRRIAPVHDGCHRRIHAGEMPAGDVPRGVGGRDRGALARTIDEMMRPLFEKGAIRRRTDVLAALKKAGYAVTRNAIDYITVAAEDGTRVRLRGDAHRWLAV
jgi:hypothetical protein